MAAAGVKITILVDNRAGGGLASEHGLSLWIETPAARILFDTGQSSAALADNARALKADLSRADFVALSHGHYDHAGGLPLAARLAPHSKVCWHPAASRLRYSVRGGEPARAIGIPPESEAALAALPPGRVLKAASPVELFPGAWLTGPVPRESGEDTGGPFYLDPGGKTPDPLEDDLALWVQTPAGVVVCAGCSHAGLVNTLNFVRRLADAPVRAVIGGFHLQGATPLRMIQTVTALRELSPELIVPCHCTGEEPSATLRAALGSRVVVPGAAGMVFRL